jgi:hypothetical protein
VNTGSRTASSASSRRFLDFQTFTIHCSRFADGALAAKARLIPGFMRGGYFYTRTAARAQRASGLQLQVARAEVRQRTDPALAGLYPRAWKRNALVSLPGGDKSPVQARHDDAAARPSARSQIPPEAPVPVPDTESETPGM